MTDVQSSAFQTEFIAHLTPIAGREIHLQGFTVGAALTVIAQLQLALRHPGNRGPSFKAALLFTRQLIDVVAGDDATIRCGLEAGFHPECDVAQPNA